MADYREERVEDPAVEVEPDVVDRKRKDEIETLVLVVLIIVVAIICLPRILLLFGVHVHL